MRRVGASLADPAELAPQMMEFGYETKSTDYLTVARQEMLPFLPPDCRHLLDVGCGTGLFGELVKQNRKVEVGGASR